LTRFYSARRSDTFVRIAKLLLPGAILAFAFTNARGQSSADPAGNHYYIDCSASAAGDGSKAQPWDTLEAAQKHRFVPGDMIALARGSTCRGTFNPQGSGTVDRPIRLTAFGEGPRPRIIAPADAQQILQLSDQEYWQIDSLDLSGANKYGIFISADRGPLHHIYLKNLYVHDVYGGELKNKDNGLVLVGRSSETAFLDDVLVDGVDAAHTNQWAGIMVGGGNYGNGPNPILNRHVTVRNSTAHDVYGDGIVLFRDQDSVIRTSAAWETGMQSTETTGTPNAIWTWTCTDCTVEDNEAYVTDSPGVDGGAYDIDWHNTRNTLQRNYAHDTQGYCIAVFAAGFTTSESVVRENLCMNNGLSPRLAALQGAVYLHTWNDGPIRGLVIEKNTIDWNPPVPDAAALVNDALVNEDSIVFRQNLVTSATPRIYRSNARLAPSENTYLFAGDPVFTLGDLHDVSLAALQKAGQEKGSVLARSKLEPSSKAVLSLDASLELAFDRDGLLAPETRAQLVVLRSLAGQYGADRLKVRVRVRSQAAPGLEANALRDLEDVYPGALHFDHTLSPSGSPGVITLRSSAGAMLQQWHGFQNAATLGGTVRALLGAPQFSHMQRPLSTEEER
jgi:Right handed beta helix region